LYLTLYTFRFMPPITQMEGFFAVFSSGNANKPMRKSTGDLIFDFIVLCNERKATKKLREWEGFIDHNFDKSVIAAICEYQLSLPLEEFMATGFVGRVV
jgi:hypothetical protein